VPRKRSNASVILADPDVRRWYENLARGSQGTADVAIHRLAAFCDSAKADPAALLKLSERKLHDLFLDFVSAEEKRGKAGSYVLKSTTAVRSWLKHNGVIVTRPIKVRNAEQTPRIAGERTPSQDELRRILLAADPKTRTACGFVAFSGVRLEVLGNYLGDDGLRVRDLPELVVSDGPIRFDTIPARVHVRSELSKSRRAYTTFLGAEGCEYVRAYLEERVRRGEKLGPDTDILTPERSTKAFIRTLNIGDAVRKAIRAAGFEWRPYVLRAYFDTQLLIAESKGKLARDYRVFWMGHVGGMDARYTTNKGRLPKELTDDMRAAYKRCEAFLSTVPTSGEADRVRVTLTMLLRYSGYSEAELSKLDLDSKSNDELLAMAEARRAERERAAVHPGQKAVPIAEVEPMLAAGWEYIGPLGTDRVVLRLDSAARPLPP
jgi:integrase